MIKEEQKVNQSCTDFLFSELEYVNGHIDTIHDTRDRFFAQFLTVALGLYGLFGFILAKEGGLSLLKASNSPNFFVILLMGCALLLGVGTIFIIGGNSLARDFYRQRRTKLINLLLRESMDMNNVNEYLSFSRDQAVWRYRVTSIYTIYSIFISAINATNVIIILFFLGLKLTSLSAIAIGFGLLVFQQLSNLLYLKLYTRRPYREG
jgi:hypothetical protein